MTDTAGQWVTIAEAAQELGLSERTVRRWAEVGKLPIRREVHPHLVDIAGHNAAKSDTPTGRVAELEAELARLRERLQELTQERNYLRQLAASLATSQQKLLEAPRRAFRWPWQKSGE